jgi:hypothetical protein
VVRDAIFEQACEEMVVVDLAIAVSTSRCETFAAEGDTE